MCAAYINRCARGLRGLKSGKKCTNWQKVDQPSRDRIDGEGRCDHKRTKEGQERHSS